eukprot:TRINITY_DN3395_c0_g1_i1.p1 TRINITY_DN3395_c0_g1~~TRINITY_DN3395_c0_g1_i1.p1  ORF type:complete len:619 (+),score=102.87 TRINITY_DN3395_c0_g1_i1:41-1858(+)
MSNDAALAEDLAAATLEKVALKSLSDDITNAHTKRFFDCLAAQATLNQRRLLMEAWHDVRERDARAGANDGADISLSQRFEAYETWVKMLTDRCKDGWIRNLKAFQKEQNRMTGSAELHAMLTGKKPKKPKNLAQLRKDASVTGVVNMIGKMNQESADQLKSYLREQSADELLHLVVSVLVGAGGALMHLEEQQRQICMLDVPKGDLTHIDAAVVDHIKTYPPYRINLRVQYTAGSTHYIDFYTCAPDKLPSPDGCVVQDNDVVWEKCKCPGPDGKCQGECLWGRVDAEVRAWEDALSGEADGVVASELFDEVEASDKYFIPDTFGFFRATGILPAFLELVSADGSDIDLSALNRVHIRYAAKKAGAPRKYNIELIYRLSDSATDVCRGFTSKYTIPSHAYMINIHDSGTETPVKDYLVGAAERLSDLKMKKPWVGNSAKPAHSLFFNTPNPWLELEADVQNWCRRERGDKAVGSLWNAVRFSCQGQPPGGDFCIGVVMSCGKEWYDESTKRYWVSCTTHTEYKDPRTIIPDAIVAKRGKKGQETYKGVRAKEGSALKAVWSRALGMANFNNVMAGNATIVRDRIRTEGWYKQDPRMSTLPPGRY